MLCRIDNKKETLCKHVSFYLVKWQQQQYIYMQTVSSYRLPSALSELGLNWFNPIPTRQGYGPFGQCNMHHTLNFCPDHPGRKRAYCPNLYTVVAVLPCIYAIYIYILNPISLYIICLLMPLGLAYCSFMLESVQNWNFKLSKITKVCNTLTITDQKKM